MYFPYLRGKRYELIAIKKLINDKKINDKILPIIEPVNEKSSDFNNFVMYMIAHKKKFVAIQNPQVGSYKPINTKEFNDARNSRFFIKGRIIKSQTDIDILKKMSSEDTAAVFLNSDIFNLDVSKIDNETVLKIIPDNTSFKMKFQNSKKLILLDDKFNKQKNNSEYLNKPDEFFSIDHQIFDNAGYFGFSDYSIIGKEYNKKGWIPKAVSIHIVYFDENDELRIQHFTSNSNDDTSDQKGKVSEALRKFADWYVDQPKKNQSSGADILIKDYTSKKSPALGQIKEYSIMHHLEVLNRYLDERKKGIHL